MKIKRKAKEQKNAPKNGCFRKCDPRQNAIPQKKERRANTALSNSHHYKLEICNGRIALGQATVIVTNFRAEIDVNMCNRATDTNKNIAIFG